MIIAVLLPPTECIICKFCTVSFLNMQLLSRLYYTKAHYE